MIPSEEIFTLKTFGIFPNTEKDSKLFGTAKVCGYLKNKADVLVHNSLRDKLAEALGGTADGIRFVDDGELFERSDVIITLGGDGTIIKAARSCAVTGVPIVGINLGRLGYLAELELDEICLLDRVLDGDYETEKRMMLEAKVGGETLFALNEAVIGGASIFRIVDTELYCGGKKVNKYRADGIIASTPTGSTAYSMSAGGAVVDPGMEALLITPICSHSLSATPLIFSADCVLSVKNVSEREPELYLNVDGCEVRRIGFGESVEIRKSPYSVTMLRLKDGGFYEVLHRKMADE